MDDISEKALSRLLQTMRVSALGTSHDGRPFVSMVSLARESDASSFYIHVSHLAQHTRDMEANPLVSLLLAEIDDGRADPQTLARVTIQCRAELITREDETYASIRELYVTQFPASAQMFSFADFNLWRLVPEKARFVGGFARAFNLTPVDLRRAIAGS